MLNDTRRYFVNKLFSSAKEALKGVVRDDQLLAVGGFGLCGIPTALIEALLESGVGELETVSNNCGVDQWGLGMLLSAKVNQWTLLVGSLWVAYTLGGGGGAPLPLDDRQTEEFLLTSAQALLAFAVLAGVLTYANVDVFANFARLGACTLLGWWFLGYFESVSWVVLVAAIIPIVDSFSVWRGPTKEITTHHEHVFTNVLSLAFPVPGSRGTANLGVPDLLFFALFLGAAQRFGPPAAHALVGVDERVAYFGDAGIEDGADTRRCASGKAARL